MDNSHTSRDANQQNMQQFEQIITTVFTCRSVVKYDLVLSAVQKDDLLRDIDSALDMLRSCMLPLLSTSTEVQVGAEPAQEVVQQTSDLLSVSGTDRREEAPSQQTLLALYRMYHAYLDTSQSTNINTFVLRFNDVMLALDEIQQTIDQSSGVNINPSVAHPASSQLQSVRGFIADLYYIFMEFLRMLSEALQQNDVQFDTEKLSALQSDQLVEQIRVSGSLKRDLQPLISVYQAHQQLHIQKGNLASRVTEACTFLAFLKDRYDTYVPRREEILLQLNNVIYLLNDLSSILNDYEVVASRLQLHNK